MRRVRRCRPEAKKCTMHTRTEAQRQESFRQVNASCAIEDSEGGVPDLTYMTYAQGHRRVLGKDAARLR